MSKLLLLCCLVGANSFDETFVNANGAYRAALYPEAVRGYENLVASRVVDPVLFYNLGNAYYRNGQIGEAIANYERALALDPTLVNASENLAHALRSAERGLDAPRISAWEEALLFWHGGFSPGAVRGIALFAWIGFWVALAVRVWRPYPFARSAAIALCLVAALCSLSWWSKTHPPLLAVAAEERVPVRFGTNPSDTIRFELFEGDRVAVEDRRIVTTGPETGNRWLRIRTAGGERGWAPEAQMAVVGPPYVRGVIDGHSP